MRDQLSRRLAERGIEAAPDRILLTDSGSHAIDLICRAFLQPGDTVLVEDPGYFLMFDRLRKDGVRIASPQRVVIDGAEGVELVSGEARLVITPEMIELLARALIELGIRG